MALQLKYQGNRKEKTAEGVVYYVVWYGTKAECDAQMNNAVINSTTAGLGRLVSASVNQGEGDFWEVTYKYNSAGYASGSSVTGAKSSPW